jgi:hypothetical protein
MHRMDASIRGWDIYIDHPHSPVKSFSSPLSISPSSVLRKVFGPLLNPFEMPRKDSYTQFSMTARASSYNRLIAAIIASAPRSVETGDRKRPRGECTQPVGFRHPRPPHPQTILNVGSVFTDPRLNIVEQAVSWSGAQIWGMGGTAGQE